MATVVISAGEAARIAQNIISNNREVQGRYSDNTHLYHDTVEDDGDVVKVKFWSEQGVLHDCWITVTIRPTGAATCDIQIDHCGDSGVQDIEDQLWEALS